MKQVWKRLNPWYTLFWIYSSRLYKPSLVYNAMHTLIFTVVDKLRASQPYLFRNGGWSSTGFLSSTQQCCQPTHTHTKSSIIHIKHHALFFITLLLKLCCHGTIFTTYFFLNGKIMRCSSSPNIPKDIKPCTRNLRDSNYYSFIKWSITYIKVCGMCVCVYLSIIGHSAEELQLEIKPSRIAV